MFRPFGPERHKLALYKANKISVLEDSGARNPFRQDDYPRSQLPSTVHVHCRAAHLLVSVQMNSCLPEQLFHRNWITDEENSCYQNSSLPGNLWYRSITFSAQVHHAYFNIA